MRLWLPIVLALPLVVTACPALLSDWKVSGRGAGDASVDATGPGAGGSSGSNGGSSSGGSSSSGGVDGGLLHSENGLDGEANGAGGSINACATGTVRCLEAQPQTCVSGVWLANGAACSGSTPVCLNSNGGCVTCNPGSRSCASQTQPETCDASGSWAAGTDCPTATPLCSEGACAAICCKSTTDTTVLSCDLANSSTQWDCLSGSAWGLCGEPGHCTSTGLTCGVVGQLTATGTVEACP